MKLVRCLDDISGGKERQLHPIIQTYCIEAGQLEDLDFSLAPEELTDCFHADHMRVSPDFLYDNIDDETVIMGTFYIAVDINNDSYQVFRAREV